MEPRRTVTQRFATALTSHISIDPNYAESPEGTAVARNHEGAFYGEYTTLMDDSSADK